MNNPITCYYSSNDYGDKNMLVPLKVDFGVRILVHLASLQPDAIEKATEISKKRHIPEKFLFQISNELIESAFPLRAAITFSLAVFVIIIVNFWCRFWSLIPSQGILIYFCLFLKLETQFLKTLSHNF